MRRKKYPKKNPVFRGKRYFKPRDMRYMTGAERRVVMDHIYADKVRALRKLNRGFEAKDGYNLRDIKQGIFPSARKARVNKYAKGQAAELAAIETGRAYFARLRNKDRLAAAVHESQQEEFFRDQKAAVFVTDFPEQFKLKTRVLKVGIRFDTTENKHPVARLRFEDLAPDWKVILADDPAYMVELALAQFGPEYKSFRYMTGKYRSNRVLSRKELPGVLASLVLSYLKEFDTDVTAGIEYLGSWLTGIVGYA